MSGRDLENGPHRGEPFIKMATLQTIYDSSVILSPRLFRRPGIVRAPVSFPCSVECSPCNTHIVQSQSNPRASRSHSQAVRCNNLQGYSSRCWSCEGDPGSPTPLCSFFSAASREVKEQERKALKITSSPGALYHQNSFRPTMKETDKRAGKKKKVSQC